MPTQQRDWTLVTGGALVGAAIVLLLVPRTRRTVVRVLEDWVRENLGSTDWSHDELEQEAAATEGGLAGTRSWRKAAVAGS